MDQSTHSSATDTLRQTILHGDNKTLLPLIPDNTYDTLITDPPYGLKFRGNQWDYDVPSVDLWRQCFRVLKPGATALVFAGARTQHRMAMNVEEAGFYICDCLMWIYSSGMPKGTDVSKQLDKSLGIRRPALSRKPSGISDAFNSIGQGKTRSRTVPVTLPASPLAQHWDGWHSHSLKPAYEPILLAQKPNQNSYADNAIAWQVAGLNIGGCVDAAYDVNPRFPANILVEPTDDDHAEHWQQYFYFPKASRKERGAHNTHPTVKPLDLMVHLVRLTKTPTGGSVLDPFAGSGTTGMACKLEDRYFLGIEQEAEFVAIAQSRINDIE